MPPQNVANTIWRPTNPQIGEYVPSGVNSIDDPVGVLLVDPSGIQIVDTGVTFTLIAKTTWLDSPGN